MKDEKFLLFCFPFAGGTMDFYNDIEIALGNRVKVVKLEYAGHGTRMKEPLYSNFEDVTNDLYPQIERTLYEFPKMEYSMLGYSMGSIAVFDMLLKMKEKRLQRKPWRVFLSAHEPQPVSSLRSVPLEKIDDWVKKRTIEFGGLDRKLIENDIFWRVYLPIFRSDYLMIANYEFDSLKFNTVIPATIFYSEEDTPYSEMKEWKKYFVADCEFVKYCGPHFFIENYYEDMSNVILRNYEYRDRKRGSNEI